MAWPPMPLISATTSCAGAEPAAGAVALDAEVVDHDRRALGGERERVRAAEPTPGTGDDDDATVTDYPCATLPLSSVT